MANQWDLNSYDDDDDDDNTNQTGQQGKPQLPSAARKRMREMEAELKAAKEELAKVAKDKRQSTVAETVKAKGFDPGVAAIVPEGVDDVGAWLDTNGALFVKASPQEEKTEDTPSPEEAEMMALWAKMAGATATAPGVVPTKEGDLMRLINATDSAEALTKLLQTGGKVPIK